MEIINNQGKNELQDALLNYALDHNIAYLLIKSDPHDPALSFKKENYICINTNWYNPQELPFIIGHEIGHMMIGEQGVKYFNSFAGKYSEEEAADLYSLELIYNYSRKHGNYFQEPAAFIQSYGIPWRMIHAAEVLFKNDQDLIS